MKSIIKKTIAFTLGAFFTISGYAQQGYGEIRGVIKNNQKETVAFATVKIVQDKLLIGGTQTDENGNYKYKPLNPGVYDIIITEAGHVTKQLSSIKVIPNEATYVNIKLTVNTLETVTVTAKIEKEDYTRSGVDNTMYSMKSMDATEILQNASIERGNIISAIPAMTSDVVQSANGELHFRGSRSDANGFYVDGVRVTGMDFIPGLSIENLTVFSGGVPAMYGDVTSGVVIVTTKSYFSGIREKRMRENRMKERLEAKKAEEEEKKELENGVIFN